MYDEFKDAIHVWKLEDIEGKLLRIRCSEGYVYGIDEKDGMIFLLIQQERLIMAPK